MRALALCGGPGHPVEETAPTIEALFERVEVHTDPERGLAALDGARHDVLVVSALAFTMGDARYDAVRADQAFSLSASGRAAVEGWLGAGRPLLALHAAVISFDDWPRWGEILGARWVWGRSHHPPLGPVRVDTPNGERFEVVDERYCDLEPVGERELLATSDGHPVAWRRREAHARVLVDLLGHDARSLAHPAHRSFLSEHLHWLEGAAA